MMGRWYFEAARKHADRGTAWMHCVRAGLRVGIPQHAWRKVHTLTVWAWQTADPSAIDAQTELLRKKRDRSG
jgi:hypothetical protein